MPSFSNIGKQHYRYEITVEDKQLLSVDLNAILLLSVCICRAVSRCPQSIEESSLETALQYATATWKNFDVSLNYDI